MGLQNVFLSRGDLDSFSAPKDRLEEQYADVYGAWKSNNNEQTREKLLSALSPFIEKTVRGIPGGDPNYLAIRGKILAMKAMDRYDSSQSALETYRINVLNGGYWRPGPRFKRNLPLSG